MNLDSVSYLNTPEDQFQQFIAKFIIKFRPHSQSKFLLDIQIFSWILELSSLEHFSPKTRSDLWIIFSKSYLNTREE